MSSRIGVLVLGAATTLLTVAGPPPTPKVDYVCRDHNSASQSTSPFEDWLSAEADYAHKRLNAIPGRAALLSLFEGADLSDHELPHGKPDQHRCCSPPRPSGRRGAARRYGGRSG